MKVPVFGNLETVQRFQVRLLADVERLSDLNGLLMTFYQVAKLPPGLQCHWAECPDCKAQRAVERKLKQR